MKTVTSILDTLHAAGITVALHPDGIKITPASILTDDLRRLIRANKTALMDLLTAANESAKPFPDPYQEHEIKSLWDNPPMTSGEVETFTVRMLLFMHRGLAAYPAELLACKLTRRDREADDRRMCTECDGLRGHAPEWRCARPRAAELGGAGLPAELVIQPQRCPAFQPAALAMEDHRHDQQC